MALIYGPMLFLQFYPSQKLHLLVLVVDSRWKQVCGLGEMLIFSENENKIFDALVLIGAKKCQAKNFTTVRFERNLWSLLVLLLALFSFFFVALACH